MNFGAIQTHRAQLDQLHLFGHLQHLQKKSREFINEARAKGGQCVVIRVAMRNTLRYVTSSQLAGQLRDSRCLSISKSPCSKVPSLARCPLLRMWSGITPRFAPRSWDARLGERRAVQLAKQASCNDAVRPNPPVQIGEVISDHILTPRRQ